MISFAAQIVVALMAVIVLPRYSALPWIVPRGTFLVIATYVLAGTWFLSGPVIYLPPFVTWLGMLMIGWWLFTSFLAENREPAMVEGLKFSAAAFLGLFLITPEYRIPALYLMVCYAMLNAVIAIMQNLFHIQVLARISSFKPFYACGLTRSPNVLGPYLMVHIIFGVYLATHHSLWWVGATAPMVLALWLTGCRAALISLLAAGAIYSPWIIGISMALGAISLASPTVRGRLFTRIATLKDRLNFVELAILQIPRCSIMGLGFDNVKRKVPFLQMELNKATGGDFLDQSNYEDPVPRKLHNDYLQATVDSGVPGLFFLLAFLAVGVWDGFASSNPLHFAASCALVGLAVNGLFFHVHYAAQTHVVFWWILGLLLQNSGMGTPLEVNAYHWIGYALIGFLVVKYSVTEQIFNIYHDLERQSNDLKWAKRALKIRPSSSIMLAHAAQVHAGRGDHVGAIVRLHQALNRFDGDMRIWFLWTQLGTSYWWLGDMLLAELCYDRALQFLPYYRPALDRKEQVRSIMDSMEKAAA